MPCTIMARIINLKIFQKSPVGVFLRLNKWIWDRLPESLTALSPIRSYGTFLHNLVCLRGDRRQFFGTFFLRNRPELELIRRLSEQKGKGSALKLAVLGCSNGAEVYSILWSIRSARPDLNVITHAVDISKDILDLAQKGVYSLNNPELVEQPIFQRMTDKEMREIFDKEDGKVTIKSWIKEGIMWRLGDAGDPEIINVLGLQDMVVANNFLCHMNPPDAERCLRNIARLVKPGGYLLVSGIDLDIRTKVASDLSWKPVPDLMEEIHDGDPIVRHDWPFGWWGLEPLNKKKNDWKIRYASVFQIGQKL